MSEFDDFYNDVLTVEIESPGTMYHGVFRPGTTQTIDIKCDIQPSSRDLIYREYGYDIDAQWRAFADYCDVKIGCKASFVRRGVTYNVIIERIVQWDEYIDLILREISNG